MRHATRPFEAAATQGVHVKSSPQAAATEGVHVNSGPQAAATLTELPGVRTIHAKTKPTAATTAFCVYVNLL